MMTKKVGVIVGSKIVFFDFLNANKAYVTWIYLGRARICHVNVGFDQKEEDKFVQE